MEETGKKKAPAGYYTASQAIKRLNMPRTTFFYQVRRGKIPRTVFPGYTEAVYAREVIDEMADVQTILQWRTLDKKTYESAVFREAQPEDAPGIYQVLASMGWPATPPERRLTWYAVNPHIDFVLVQHLPGLPSLVLGYLNAVPYTPLAMADHMSGRRRGWQMHRDDILPYLPNKVYDVFVGIAVRRDVPYKEHYAARLISGYLRMLEAWATQGITIRRFLANSDQEEGMDLLADLGFQMIGKLPGDLFYRFELDSETADSDFAHRYRASLKRS